MSSATASWSRFEDAAGLPAAFRKARAYAKSFYILAYDPDATLPRGNPSGQADPAAVDAQVEVGSSRPTLGSWHNVRVELRRPLLDVIVRPGYYRQSPVSQHGSTGYSVNAKFSIY